MQSEKYSNEQIKYRERASHSEYTNQHYHSVWGGNINNHM